MDLLGTLSIQITGFTIPKSFRDDGEALAGDWGMISIPSTAKKK